MYDVTNNAVISSDYDKASYLSRQWVFINIIDSNLSPLKTIGNTLSSQSASPSFSSYPIKSDVVRNTNNNNSPSGIPKALLKMLSFQLYYHLSIIYANFLKTGISPDIWKMSHILSIFLKDNATKAIHYRLISMLPTR